MGLQSLKNDDLQSLNGGLLLVPWKELAKLVIALAKEVIENWDEYQEAYQEGYEAARNNGY